MVAMSDRQRWQQREVDIENAARRLRSMSVRSGCIEPANSKGNLYTAVFRSSFFSTNLASACSCQSSATCAMNSSPGNDGSDVSCVAAGKVVPSLAIVAAAVYSGCSEAEVPTSGATTKRPRR